MDERSCYVELLLTGHSLRAQIGVVPQAPILFDDTIMNNVRYAKLTATDEEVYEACKAASIHDQILTFTDGRFSQPYARTKLTTKRLSNQGW
jgi:ABC-type multidrug transport system fused ATPase/permease subunit